MSNRISKDRRKGRKPPLKWVQPRIARISVEIDEIAGVGLATCSCGWEKWHARRKVLEDGAQRHLEKRHGGQGLWF